MAKYTAIKAELEKRHTELFNKCQVFWAFSQEQFLEGTAKYPLPKGEKYVSIGMGGFMPKSKHGELTAGLAALKQWEKGAIKQAKADEVILYELNNYECFYTGEITDALEVLEPLGYTPEQVRAVYHKYQTTAYIN